MQTISQKQIKRWVTLYIANRAFSDKLKVQSHLQSPQNLQF